MGDQDQIRHTTGGQAGGADGGAYPAASSSFGTEMDNVSVGLQLPWNGYGSLAPTAIPSETAGIGMPALHAAMVAAVPRISRKGKLGRCEGGQRSWAGSASLTPAHCPRSPPYYSTHLRVFLSRQ